MRADTTRVRAQRTLAVGLLHAVLAGWLTWPLAGHLGSHLPQTFPAGAFDPLYSAWALAWESDALAHGSLALADANIYHPEQDALFYGPPAFGALPGFAPVFLLTGNPALALNLLFLAGVALTAAALHLVVRAWTGSQAAGLVAGVSFLANRWLLWTFIPTVPHLAVLCYLPPIVFLVASGRDGGRWTLLLLLLVTLQCATDIVYVAPATLAPLATVALGWLLRRTTRGRGARLLAVVVAAALGVLAAHAPVRSILRRNPALPRQTNWLLDPSAGVLDLPGGLMGFMSPLAMPSLAPALVAVAGALLLAGRWRGSRAERSAWGHALLWTAVGLAISLPDTVRWGGAPHALAPLALARRWIPLAGVIRLPERLRVAALIGVALLAGLAFAEVCRHAGLGDRARPRVRRARGAIAALLCAAMVAQYRQALFQPAAYGPAFPSRYPVVAAPAADSPVLRALREAGGPTVEVPLPRDPRRLLLPEMHAPAMYRSIVHRQPLLNGYSAYWPAAFPARMALAARLPDPDALRALRRDTGLAFVLVRARPEGAVDATLGTERDAWRELARRGGSPDLAVVAADDRFLLFRVRDDAPP